MDKYESSHLLSIISGIKAILLIDVSYKVPENWRIQICAPYQVKDYAANTLNGGKLVGQEYHWLQGNNAVYLLVVDSEEVVALKVDKVGSRKEVEKGYLHLPDRSNLGSKSHDPGNICKVTKLEK
jgi:hypothetical protein